MLPLQQKQQFMNYPLISEYIEAIRSAEDNFDELKHLRPVLDDDGEPMMTSGNFAVVFKMRDEQTGKLHAVKCFLKEQEGRADAYRMIAEELEYVNSTFLTPIKYLDKELFVDSKNSDETEFPVLLMDWVEGMTLDKYLREHIDDQYELSLLAYQFSRLAMWLMPQPFAHGDLKPDNILVKDDGTLVLVDYDGMYVPSMKGQKARELGSPDFRHPSRTENDFDEHIDDFPLSSILLSLLAIANEPSLLEKYGGDGRLLLSERDYRNIAESEVLDALRPLMADKNLTTYLSLFYLCSAQKSLFKESYHLFTLPEPEKPSFILVEEDLSTEVTEEDLANAWTDEYGGKYSKDCKRFLRYDDEYTYPIYHYGYIIKDGVEIVCDNAFHGCQRLKMIKLPPTITAIGDCAFESCSNLESLILPSKLKCIGGFAFRRCFALKSIIIPKEVTYLGANPFASSGIEKVTCNSPYFESDGNGVFDQGKRVLITLFDIVTNYTVPNTVIHIGMGACWGNKKLSSLILTDNVETIGKDAFCYCDMVTITISNNLKQIEEGAFYSCCINELFLPTSIRFIGENAFSNDLPIIIDIGKRFYFDSLFPEYKEQFMERVTIDSHSGLKRIFSSMEIKMIVKADVIRSTFTYSVRFNFTNGCQINIPLCKDSNLSIGDAVDLTKAKLIELSGEGIYYGNDGVYGDYYSKYLVEA